MEEIEKLKKELRKIEKDCLELKKKGELTEWGKAELNLIEIIKKYIKFD